MGHRAIQREAVKRRGRALLEADREQTDDQARGNSRGAAQHPRLQCPACGAWRALWRARWRVQRTEGVDAERSANRTCGVTDGRRRGRA
eukprot:1251531-Pleurochrysis_carterae.AAC.1